MVTWVRTVLVWLLVLALPMQGAAAATMALCGPGHAARTIGHQHEQAMAEQAPHMHRHGHPASLEPHHHAHAVLVDAGDPGRDQAETAGQAEPPNLAQGDQHKCSACASCCSAAAVFRAGLIVPAPDFTPTVFMAVVATVEPFTTAGPDRPPRLPRV